VCHKIWPGSAKSVNFERILSKLLILREVHVTPAKVTFTPWCVNNRPIGVRAAKFTWFLG